MVSGDISDAMEQQNIEPSREPDVFISYSTKNKDVADAIVAYLEQSGIQCWYAPRNIAPGQEWVTAIRDALTAAKVFVLIFTQESNDSRQVMNEVALAFNGAKSMVPLRLTEAPMNAELEYYLTRVHWLDATNLSQEKYLEELRKYVERSMRQPDLPLVHRPSTTAESFEKAYVNATKRPMVFYLGITVAVAVLCFVLGIAFYQKLWAPKPEALTEASKQSMTESSEQNSVESTEEAKSIEELGALADECYYQGNYEEALRYYLEMVELNPMNGPILSRLGTMYLEGMGTDLDAEEGYRYLARAYDFGEQFFPYEAYLLGRAYYYGTGIEEDLDKAFLLMKYAAEEGDYAYSHFLLGEMYYAGMGTNIDYHMALKWLGSSLDRNNGILSEGDETFAYAAIHAMYHNGYVSEEEAAKWLRY